jgi:predicted AAA+ superfamily ATPase
MDIELGGSQHMTELILTGAASDLVNKGSLTEMVVGWELIKNMSPRVSHDLYYWENISNGSSSEVDYLIAQDMKVVPLEVKSGVTGKMKSLRLFMQRKHCLVGKRCSLENFGVLDFVDSEDSQYPTTQKHIFIYPLYSLSSI